MVTIWERKLIRKFRKIPWKSSKCSRSPHVRYVFLAGVELWKGKGLGHLVMRGGHKMRLICQQ